MLTSIFGYELLKKDKKLSTLNLNVEYIGIYFSAHWCPPCKNFTPRLASRYFHIKSMRKSFEIVFVSLDKEINSFNLYFASMPWLAIPFEANEIRQRMSWRYGISGIPALVIINKKGYLIEKNARDKIMDDCFIQNIPNVIDKDISNMSVEQVINNFVSNETVDLKFKIDGFNTLRKIFNNVSRNPGDEKYLILKKSNAAVQKKLGHPDLIKILKHGGFIEDEEVYDLTQNLNYTQLKEIVELLSQVISSLESEQENNS